MIRDDFQKINNVQNVYAATFVLKIFCMMITFVVDFHLKIRQLNAVNCQAHRNSIVYLMINRRRSKKWEKRMRMWELIYSSSLNLAYQF
jgi:hypothetical protein